MVESHPWSDLKDWEMLRHLQIITWTGTKQPFWDILIHLLIITLCKDTNKLLLVFNKHCDHLCNIVNGGCSGSDWDRVNFPHSNPCSVSLCICCLNIIGNHVQDLYSKAGGKKVGDWMTSQDLRFVTRK